MSIYCETKQFKPTFLYIKQHAITGKLYFGKTTRNPEKYMGSGVHWKNHISKYGIEYVENLWYCLFLDEAECVAFAAYFSEINNIVESTDWMNLVPESGIGGSWAHITDDIRRENGKRNKGRKFSSVVNKSKGLPGEKNPMFGVHRYGEAAPRFGVPMTADSKIKHSASMRAIPKIQCPHCGISCSPANAAKHHLDNCHMNPNLDFANYALRKMLGRVTRISDRKELDCGNWAKYIKSVVTITEQKLI